MKKYSIFLIIGLLILPIINALTTMDLYLSVGRDDASIMALRGIPDIGYHTPENIGGSYSLRVYEEYVDGMGNPMVDEHIYDFNPSFIYCDVSTDCYEQDPLLVNIQFPYSPYFSYITLSNDQGTLLYQDLSDLICDNQGGCTETCYDGIQNGNEQGIDCGGGPPCEDCPTCSDGIQNQDEEGIDCGGSCMDPCLSLVRYSIFETTLTLNYGGDPPFHINIRDDQNFGQPGGYVYAITGSDLFSIDMVDFIIENELYYGVKINGQWETGLIEVG